MLQEANLGLFPTAHILVCLFVLVLGGCFILFLSLSLILVPPNHSYLLNKIQGTEYHKNKKKNKNKNTIEKKSLKERETK